MIKKLGCYFVLLCALYACNTKSTNENKGNGTLEYDSPEFSDKFNSYIALTNYYKSSDKGSSWHETLNKLDEQLGNTANNNLKKENLFLGNFMWGIDKTVKVAIANAPKSPALAEADKNVVAFGKEVISASSTLQQLESYYKGKNYLDDKYVKAAMLYQEFAKKQLKLDSLFITLAKSMAGIKENRDTYFIERYKKEDRLVRYHMLLSMRYAKAAYTELADDTIGDKFKMNYDKLAISVDELNKYASDDAALAKSGITLKSTFGNYLNYLTSIKGNFRLLMDSKDSAKRVEIMKKVDADFEEMIDDYNRL